MDLYFVVVKFIFFFLPSYPQPSFDCSCWADGGWVGF